MSKQSAVGKPKKIDGKACFISVAKLLQKLTIANFVTKMARLNTVIKLVDNNTYIATLNL